MGSTLQTCKGCTDPTINFQSKDYHEISSYYTSKLADFQQILPNIPQYENPLYSRLVNELRRSQEKFQDFNFHYIGLSEKSGVEWVRLGTLPNAKHFCRNPNSFNFDFKNESNKELKSIEKALLFLSENFDLVKRIFDNIEISKQGFYILHFCLSGNLQKTTDIVIDDFIPVEKGRKYFLKEVQETDGIWMNLIVKAWAKILGSYEMLDKMNQNQYISEMTGVPIPRLYQKGDFLISSRYQFKQRESKYLKICRDSSVKLILAIWQNFKSQSTQNFIIQVIQQRLSTSSRDYQLLPLSSQLINNKFTLLDISGNMFELQKGQYIVHIYNISQQIQNCSIVTHARRPVNAHTRYENEFKEAKNTMIINEYTKLHSSTALQFEFPGIELRFCWIKHRGVFCFKNKSNESKKICMKIKKYFLDSIVFEDWESVDKELVLKQRKAGFIVVIRNENKQYGPFYEIEVKSAT